MKTKPFDLKAALAGAKVVTRDGRDIVNLKRWSENYTGTYPVSADIVGGHHSVWTATGKYQSSIESHKWDLVLVDDLSVRTMPFNLEAALKGEPVVTRAGQIVSDLKRFETVDRVWGVRNGRVKGWYLNGRVASSLETNEDLFMVAPEPKMREVWLNIYPAYACSHNTADDAEQSADRTRIGKAHRILIPEEEAE